ncbi:MAG: hypothetical protein FWC50_09620 [Planctomycetaceae bacterium]|nr:hypothetical protein [Planctomycetaceae bacterium]
MTKKYLFQAGVFFVATIFLFHIHLSLAGDGQSSEDRRSVLLLRRLGYDPSKNYTDAELFQFSFKKMSDDPMGDYSKLEYSILSDKDQYDQGEPIFIFQHVKNHSDDFVNLDGVPISLFSTDSVKVIDAKGNDVPLTRYGQNCMGREKDDSKNNRRPFRPGGSIYYIDRNQTAVLEPGFYVLNNYFDMTMPGVYQVTFSRLRFVHGHESIPAVTSNTLTIEVKDKAFPPKKFDQPGTLKPETNEKEP